MKIGFTGTQEGLTEKQDTALFNLLFQMNPSEVHHGDCEGADLHFHKRCGRLIRPRIVIHPPSNCIKRAWCEGDVTWPAKPYLKRNHDIVDNSEVLIACPKEEDGEMLRSGTWSTVRYARKLKRPIYIIRPSGKVEKEYME